MKRQSTPALIPSMRFTQEGVLGTGCPGRGRCAQARERCRPGRGDLAALAFAGLLLAPTAATGAGAEQSSLGSPTSASGTPPWSAEAPGAAGVPLGLGLDALSERQGSLTIDSAQTIVTSQDLARGTTLTEVLEGDPALLNRKFSIRWKASGFGAQLPLALPRLALGEGLSITPTLVVQAAGSDVELDFIDLPEPQASTSLHGRGLQLGAALDLVGPLCRRCGWYAGAGYRYRFFPRFSVERGQPVEEPGARVTASDVRLGRTVGEASFRLGRVFGRDRAALYLGVLRRRARTTVDDDLTLVQDAIGQQTRLASRTRFASTATKALAGLDVHVGGPLFVRAEVTFGKGDSTVLGKLVLVPRLPPWFPEVHPGHPDPERQRASQIAAAIAPGLATIRERFAKESQRLLAQQPAPAAAEVSRLLDYTRCELLSTLNAPELRALRDYVEDLFAKAREGLGLGPSTGCALTGFADSLDELIAAPPGPPYAAAVPVEAPPRRQAEQIGGAGPVRAAAPALARAPRALPAVLSSGWHANAVRAAAQRTDINRRAAQTWFEKIADSLSTMSRQATEDDELVTLCIRSSPERAHFSLHYISAATGIVPEGQTHTNHRVRPYRGQYSYTVTLANFQPIGPIEIDLVRRSEPILNCTLVPAASPLVPDQFCDRDAGEIETECPR
jgi:hypothetical protein